LRRYILVGALAFVGLLSIGQISAQDDPWASTPQKDFLTGPIVKKFQCVTCHTITDQGGSVGPMLNMVGLRRSEEWIREWLEDPNRVKPGTKMPKFPFTADEFELAVASLTGMKRALHTQQIVHGDGSPEEKGARLFEDYDCLACHRIGKTGRFVGPDLTWIGVRKPESWERVWLRDPDAFKPGTFMPNLNIPSEAIQQLAAYLHTLQGQHNDDARESEFMINMMINNDDERRGELVWKRLACWSCHGEAGDGGVRNPNTRSGNEWIPDLEGVRDDYSHEEFLAKVRRGGSVSAADPDVEPLPFACPQYQNALNELEGADLYAYVSSFAPPELRWKIK